MNEKKRNRKGIVSYKFVNREEGRSNAYVIDIIYNKCRYKYSYSIDKYTDVYAKLLIERMQTLLQEKIDNKSLNKEGLDKINNWYEERDKCIVLFTYNSKEDKMEEILIDTEDYDKIKSYYWGAYKCNTKLNSLYALSTLNGKTLRLSHVILGLTNVNIRYKNGNTLDNRKSNLIVSTKSTDEPFIGSLKNMESVGNIRVKENSFIISYKDDDNWYEKEFNICEYESMQEAYLAAREFRNSFKK